MTHDHSRRRRARAAAWLATVVTFGVAIGASAGSLRIGLSIALAVALVIWHRWMNEPGAVPILAYHSVSARPDWLPWARGLSLFPETFAGQMDALISMGCSVIPLMDLVRARHEGRQLPDDAVVLTFDDGYLDNWVAVAPILGERRLPATFFVSLEFVAGGERERPTVLDLSEGNQTVGQLDWEGYMNRQELLGLLGSEFFDVQPHGIDHGRVPVSDEVVGEITLSNWKRLAWMQWARTPGDKSDWFRSDEPPAVAVGASVPKSAPALAARAWRDGRLETEAEYVDRVRGILVRCRTEFPKSFGREAEVFCWSEQGHTEAARRLADELGYLATTAGRGENRPEEDPSILSRTHCGDRAIGIRWRWMDVLAFRANVRVHLGCYYWYLPLALINLSRSIVLRGFRRRSLT